MREIDGTQLRAPAIVLDIDVAYDYGDDAVDVDRFATAWCLVRKNGVAVGKRFLDVHAEPSLGLAELRRLFSTNLSAAADLAELTPRAAPPMTLTVVICTRSRPDGLEMTLASLAKQSDAEFDVLIVDNSSEGDVAPTLEHYEGLRISICHEPLPGLSRARNRGLATIDSDVVAWIDDDEVADRDWMAWIKRGFASQHRPAAVAGVMLPAELETTAQVDFERYGGFNKGRGMASDLLIAGTLSAPDSLYPLPNFGAGGNMAFRTAALREIGGFDNRLGAGTLTHGGEETRALSLLLDSGSTILHWPPAVTWHYHRRSYEALEKQFYGYSAGLTAFYMSMVLSSPRYLFRIIGFIKPGLKRILANRNPGQADGPPADFPKGLLAAGRRGLCSGALLYLREVLRQRPAERQTESK